MRVRAGAARRTAAGLDSRIATVGLIAVLGISMFGLLPPAARLASEPPGSRVGWSLSTSEWTVYGSVRTSTSPAEPLVGVNVTLLGTACGSLESAATCPYVTANLTNSSGEYRLLAPPGTYFVYAHRGTVWGGDWANVTVASANVLQDLRVHRFEGYGNATLDLPAWNNLSGYASNCNAQGPCGSGIYGTQVPILSWTQDGAYYVNASNELVFDDFASGTVDPIAPWDLLFDDLMYYQGIENTAWITVDGSYVYEFGCPTDCGPGNASVPIEFYGVNTSTHRTFFHVFSGISPASTLDNAEVQMIGEAGNASIAVVITSDGVVHAFDLWNGSAWTLGTLPFFEANNVYWVPMLNSFVDVEAQGSSSDRIAQLKLEGPAPGTTLQTVFAGTYASGFTSNGVDGLYLNLSSRRLVVSEATGGGPFLTESFLYDRQSVLTGAYSTYPDRSVGTWPDDSVPPNAWSSEHRPLITSNGPMVMGLWDGLFDNGSWLFEPSDGQYLSTNVSMDHARGGPTFRQNSQSPASVENLFVNASYAIVTESVDCRTPATTCPVRGTAPGTKPGTIWWTWRLGLPEFPYPASAAGAETAPPGPIALTSNSSESSVTVRWTPPATGADPILNYTLFWSIPSQGTVHAVDLWAENRSYTIGALAPSTPVAVLVQAWNLHWHNDGTWLNASTLSSPPLQVASSFANPDPLDVGTPLTIAVRATGGVPAYSYDLEGLPPGCVSAGRSDFNCTPTSAGTFIATATVRDAEANTVNLSETIVVDPGPSLLALRAVPSQALTGEPFALHWVLEGGTGSLRILVVDPAHGCLAPPLNATTTQCTLDAPGTYSVQLEVEDGFGQTNLTTLTIVVATTVPAPAHGGGIVEPLAIGATAAAAPIVAWFAWERWRRGHRADRNTGSDDPVRGPIR